MHLDLRNPLPRARVGGVLVGEHVDPGAWRGDQAKQLRHAALDGLGIGAPESVLQTASLALLGWGHPSLSPELGVGEGVEEVAARPDGQVEVEGVVLAELEGLEAVDDERLFWSRTALVGF